MRHRRAGVKLNRTTSHRQAMFRNMVTSLLKHDRIQTTDVKAKELRRWADHIITLAKRGDLHARRQVMAIVREKEVVHKLFENAAKRFGNINGGYTRIVKIGYRPGDAAPISQIELISAEEKGKKAKKKTKAAAKTKAAPAAKPKSTKKAADKKTVEETTTEKQEAKAPEAETETEETQPQESAQADEAVSATAEEDAGTGSEDAPAPTQEPAQEPEKEDK
jgi:large subunit ribosomal protein L17